MLTEHGAGIAAVTVILSVVNGVILRPLPYPNADRAILMWMTARPGTPGPAGRLPFSGPNFLDLKAGARTLEHAAAFRSWPMTFAGEHEAQELAGAKVSAGFFEILGVRPLLGRVIGEADDVPGAEPVVALSRQARQPRRPEPRVEVQSFAGAQERHLYLSSKDWLLRFGPGPVVP